MTAERKTIFRNLVAFSAARPPWTVFMIFIGVFAFGFFLLGFYVHKNSIVDSEATKGWNHLYSNLSALVFCLNNTASQVQKEMPVVADNYPNFEMINVSLPFQLTALPYEGSMGNNASNLHGTIPRFYFKFGHQILHETKLWINVESNNLFGHCVIDENEVPSKCKEMTYSACVTVSLPNVILPLIKPRPCNATPESLHTTSIHVAGAKTHMPNLDLPKAPRCKEKEIEIALAIYDGDASEVLLSMAEKSQLNLKLQLASYFLFVIFLSFILFAALRGRPLKL